MKLNRSSFLLILLALVSSQDTLAQINSGFYFGRVKSALKGDSRTDAFGLGFGHYDSYGMGVFLDIPIKNDVQISFQPSYKIHRMYLTQEVPILTPFQNDSIEQIIWVKIADFNLHHLSLPLFMKIVSDNMHWQFVAGIETNIPLKGVLNYVSGREEVLKGELSNVSMAAVVGIGYRFKLFKNYFSVDVMYTQGLTNISTEKAIDPSYPTRIKLNSTELRLSWFLPLKKSEILEDE